MLPPIQKVGDLVKPEITDAIRKCARKLSFTEEGKLKGCLFTLAVCYSPEEAEAVEKFKESREQPFARSVGFSEGRLGVVISNERKP